VTFRARTESLGVKEGETGKEINKEKGLVKSPKKDWKRTLVPTLLYVGI